jgi:hypothetical protein
LALASAAESLSFESSLDLLVLEPGPLSIGTLAAASFATGFLATGLLATGFLATGCWPPVPLPLESPWPLF